MIEHDSKTLIAKCLDCGHVWKKNQYPIKCPKCGMPAYRYRKREVYLKEPSKVIGISVVVKQRLDRRKQTPCETYASIIDRLLNDKLSMTIFYNEKDHAMKNYSLHISPTAHEKLAKLKKEYKIKTFNEVLWRVMNIANQIK